MSAFGIAFVIYTVLGYHTVLTFTQALLIGSVVSATDPVSVVALLKELGASVKFSTILEGESLFNDGTAFVLFLVCLDAVKEGSFRPLPAAWMFIRLTIGGIAMGLISGFIAVRLMRKMRRDKI